MRKIEHVNFKFGLQSLCNKGIALNAPGKKRSLSLARDRRTPYFSIAEVNVQSLVAVIPLGGISQRDLHKECILSSITKISSPETASIRSRGT